MLPESSIDPLPHEWMGAASSRVLLGLDARPDFICEQIDPPVDLRDRDNLPDVGKRLGKVGPREYRRLKLEKLAVAESLKDAGRDEDAGLLRNCCTSLIIDKYEKGRRVRGPNECKHALCPTAQLARQRRTYRRVAKALERYLRRKEGMVGIMLTTTMESCPSHELRYRTGQLIEACSRLMTFAPVKRAVAAYVRIIEFTRNAVTQLWHPHAHYCLVVPKSYLAKGSKTFIDHDGWGKLFRKALRCAYTPVVDVRVAKGVSSPLTEAGLKTLREIVKYTTKPGTLVYWDSGMPYAVGRQRPELYRKAKGAPLEPMFNVPVMALADAVKGRRLVALSRNLEADEELDFTDDPRGDELDQTTGDLGAFICTEFYEWRGRGRHADYFLVGRSFDEPGQRKRKEGFAMGP